jgi:hypothetical protein
MCAENSFVLHLKWKIGKAQSPPVDPRTRPARTRKRLPASHDPSLTTRSEVLQELRSVALGTSVTARM